MSLENKYIHGRFLKVIATHAVPRYESGHPLVFVDYVARSYYHSRTRQLPRRYGLPKWERGLWPEKVRL